MTDKQQNNLNLNQTIPVVAKDGQTIFINEAGYANIAFFQFRSQQGNNVMAEVVAAVRFQDINDLKNLAKQIEDTIKQHESREP